MLKTDVKINQLLQRNNNWEISTNDDNLQCKLVINAAGAWCDEVAKKVNAAPINLVPKKEQYFVLNP